MVKRVARNGRLPAIVVSMLLTGLLITQLMSSGGVAGATSEPANKTSAAGSAAKVVGPGSNVTLLSEVVKTSKPEELLLTVTLECVITTELTTVGNDSQQAQGTVDVWVEIDGTPVPVSTDDTATPGKVTFCDHYTQRDTTNFDDQDATIKTLDKWGAATAFEWMALNVGSATHTITVRANFTQCATADASALAAVGKRTLTIEPTKSAQNEAVTALA